MKTYQIKTHIMLKKPRTKSWIAQGVPLYISHSSIDGSHQVFHCMASQDEQQTVEYKGGKH